MVLGGPIELSRGQVVVLVLVVLAFASVVPLVALAIGRAFSGSWIMGVVCAVVAVVAALTLHRNVGWTNGNAILAGQGIAAAAALGYRLAVGPKPPPSDP
jgi:protein-S-isoprenylcysteine O-methyltransferase Ste14